MWKTNRTGHLTTWGANQIAWLRIPDDSPIWQKYPDTSSGRDSPHIELLTLNGGLGDLAGLFGNFVGFGAIVLQPTSRGSITLGSSDPFAQPLIDTGIFTSPVNIQIMVEAMKSARKFYSAPVWNDYVLDTAVPFTEDILDDDEAVIEVLKKLTNYAWHLVGTVAMLPADADWGYVDPDLRLKKVTGLHVVDASIMPFVPAAHTQFPVYVIAERAANLIKRYWAKSEERVKSCDQVQGGLSQLFLLQNSTVTI
ncbi:FAD-linked reductase [Coprinopsis marcescibilis]|uniref:FAD-linked reductase n=1 Tax=Coprinopsis marcescibilis TaxID=230819 RepID=A0A5C3KTZ3_COPMA|nr:FAD-linked reductase [Coprinopsis marcescibilis]